MGSEFSQPRWEGAVWTKKKKKKSRLLGFLQTGDSNKSRTGSERANARTGSGNKGTRGAGIKPAHPPQTRLPGRRARKRTAPRWHLRKRAAHISVPKENGHHPSPASAFGERVSFSGADSPPASHRAHDQGPPAAPGFPPGAPAPTARGSSRLPPRASGAASPASPPPAGTPASGQVDGGERVPGKGKHRPPRGNSKKWLSPRSTFADSPGKLAPGSRLPTPGRGNVGVRDETEGPWRRRRPRSLLLRGTPGAQSPRPHPPLRALARER